MSSTKNQSVCQLTSAHPVDDERILHRFARSAAELGYESTVVGPHDGAFSFPGVSFVACPHIRGKPAFWKRRMSPLFILSWALRNRKDLYQIHDPDMLLTGLALRLVGRRVIYDVHDDYQASFETRLKKRPLLRPWIPTLWWFFEKVSSRFFSKITVADRHLAAKFHFCKPKLFGNFPRIDFAPKPANPKSDTFNVLYVGGVTRQRGLAVALEAIRKIARKDIQFHVVGSCPDRQLQQDLESEPTVKLHGRVTWTDLPQFFSKSHVGLALYQPLPAFLYCPGENAVKIIEYMAFGIPVITSNFPGLSKFVDEHDIGLTVDPTDPDKVAECLERLYQNPREREAFAKKARAAFEFQFNWELQVERLDSMYQELTQP